MAGDPSDPCRVALSRLLSERAKEKASRVGARIIVVLREGNPRAQIPGNKVCGALLEGSCRRNCMVLNIHRSPEGMMLLCHEEINSKV